MNDYDYFMDLGQDYLAHYGIKGMKWRRRKTTRNSSNPPTPKPYDSEYEKESNYNSRKNNYFTSGSNKSNDIARPFRRRDKAEIKNQKKKQRKIGSVSNLKRIIRALKG